MKRHEIEELIYGKSEQQRRFTQDFPILPDVWIAYAEHPDTRIELLLTPHHRTDAATLSRALRQRVADEQSGMERYRKLHSPKDLTKERPLRILFNESVVFANFSFEELIRVSMPLTDWWKNNVAGLTRADWNSQEILEVIHRLESGYGPGELPSSDPRLLRKLITIVGTIECDRASSARKDLTDVKAFAELLDGLSTPAERRGLLYNVSRNRPAGTSIWRSRTAVKADAAARVFDVNTKGICWAVLDVGIDATHTAFARRRKNSEGKDGREMVTEEHDEKGNSQFASRVIRTYDFLRIKDLLDPATKIDPSGSYAELLGEKELAELVECFTNHLKFGRALDWDLLEPFLRIPHVKQDRFYPEYKKLLTDSHGTHVAGIIAANWPEAKETSLDHAMFGICPELELYDLRVLGKDKSGDEADEFTVIAALQFVRHLNSQRTRIAIHGVNLSMSVRHEVANYACGRTPICEECERLVANGVVVVTAAGNRGFNKLPNPQGGAEGDYRYISITDPGNSENVITVGSTHRFMPHNYGVSYFSSRGPTGDGRIKPDLVAPGERIDSCAPLDSYETMDGTSMAAPHVSGAAALVMARHRELIGQPKRIKEILCKSATDLGREPRFQGAGMLDVLRALQSV